MYLRAMAETVYERVKGDDTRPLLRCEDPMAKIRELLDLRRDKYEAAADLVVDTDGKTPEEIARECGITGEKAEELLNLLPQVCSLDAPVGDPEHDALQAMLEDMHAPQPQEELVRQELRHTMDVLLAMLNDRQRQVLRLHFGMEDDTCHSLEQIGKMLGISKERARQIERQAMDKLRAYGADLGLEDFLQ